MKTIKRILSTLFILVTLGLVALFAADQMPSTAQDKVNNIGSLLGSISASIQGAKDFKDIEKALENNEIVPDNSAWRNIAENVEELNQKINEALNYEAAVPKNFVWESEVKKKFITLDTPVTWYDNNDKEKTWKLGEIKKLTEEVLVPAVNNVGKNYCYVFTAYMHEKGENDYILLNKPVTSCKATGIDGEDIDCGEGNSEHNTNNLYKPVRIDCKAMPKANKLGKAFASLDSFFQKTIWRQNMCFELNGGVTEAPADSLTPVKLKKGEFMGRNEFKMLELKCYHQGVHTSKTGEKN